MGGCQVTAEKQQQSVDTHGKIKTKRTIYSKIWVFCKLLHILQCVSLKLLKSWHSWLHHKLHRQPTQSLFICISKHCHHKHHVLSRTISFSHKLFEIHKNSCVFHCNSDQDFILSETYTVKHDNVSVAHINLGGLLSHSSIETRVS